MEVGIIVFCVIAIVLLIADNSNNNPSDPDE